MSLCGGTMSDSNKKCARF
uniref:Uncharacterized protein n=1 Tax=Anguilla anguilla TaxID=7936 RepID=A0A0E9RQU0_ANGAN